LRRRGPGKFFTPIKHAVCQLWKSLNHSLLPQQQAQILHAPAIDAQVAAPEARGRAHRDQVLLRPQVQLEIVDKAKDSATALGMKIIIGLRDDLGPRRPRDGRMHRRPSLFRREYKLNRRNSMRGVGVIARHAVR
jgi:hypothetical protein